MPAGLVVGVVVLPSQPHLYLACPCSFLILPHCCFLMSGFSLSNAHWSLQFVADMLVCSIVFAGGHTMSNAPDLF